MAIHKDYPGLEVEIIANGGALREYADDNGEPQSHTTTTYVEATSGDCFAVRLTISKSLLVEYGVWAVIRIDGVDICRKVFSQKNYERRGVLNCTIHTSAAVVDGKPVGQRFCFSELSRCKSPIAYS